MYDSGTIPRVPTFSDLARGAYCLRQLYYVRRNEADADHSSDPRDPPARARERIGLAFRYRELRDVDDETLRDLPIDCSPASYRDAIASLRERPYWPALVEPTARRHYLEGKDARGIAHKVLATDEGPIPSLVSPGRPPDRGVWMPQRVRAVAAAHALAWERETPVDRALIEYPAHGAVRTVRLTTRNRARYRRTLRAVRSLDGPPPRTDDASKCEPCEYSDRCGVRTRSLRSLLGL